MLTAKPRNLVSWSYTIYDHGDPLAEIDVSWVRERGSFCLGGHTFDVRRTSILHGEFALQSNGLVLATAKKPGAWVRSFEVRCQDRTYSLHALHPFARSFALDEDSRQIGSVRPLRFLSKRAEIDLPDEIALPIRIFMFWLVTTLWRRSAGAASGAGCG